ncbi:MAG TPA: neutral/alkaline non-lysosomal ceramidase N-terminal domain-containing protein [Acidobacteriota bacterium]|nr:neutral/alkaline non-lysosomal ceramidase N-terminal domain-containing protein [Acidobacteriota bacterium]
MSQPLSFATGRRLTRFVLIVVFLLLTSGAGLAQSEGRQFLAGAATSNITPWIGGEIVGGFSPQPSIHIHDELHARCLVLDDGQTRIAFVVVDSVAVPREVFDEARRQASERTGIPPNRMLMSATHTHSATSARYPNRYAVNLPLNEYQQFLARRIADGVVRAVNNLRPARVGWGVGSEPGQVFNRRWFMKPGTEIRNPFGGTDKVRMNPGMGNPDLDRPAGPVDPEISFLSVQGTDGRPIALLANYSLHYVGGTGPLEISADYFAMFADRIQQLLNADRQDPPFVGIMSNGTSGNINNNDYSQQPSGERPAPYERMRKVADVVAAEVFKVYRTIKHHDWVPLKMEQTELKLKSREVTADLLQWAKTTMAKPDDAPKYHPLEKAYAQRVLQIHESYPRELSIILQALRIGDLGIAAIPAEVFVEIGLELKEKSPFQPTFTISLANGWHGYLPTVEHHKLGGYETWIGTNLLEIEAAPKIVNTLLQLFGRLQ